MFAAGASITEIEQDVEDMIVQLVHRLGDLADADPDPVGAQERAYIKAFSDVRANSSMDQAALLETAVSRPNLAESLLYLNRRLDAANLSPQDPAGIRRCLVQKRETGFRRPRRRTPAPVFPWHVRVRMGTADTLLPEAGGCGFDDARRRKSSPPAADQKSSASIHRRKGERPFPSE